jgi:hypothetical protein
MNAVNSGAENALLHDERKAVGPVAKGNGSSSLTTDFSIYSATEHRSMAAFNSSKKNRLVWPLRKGS